MKTKVLLKIRGKKTVKKETKTGIKTPNNKFSIKLPPFKINLNL